MACLRSQPGTNPAWGMVPIIEIFCELKIKKEKILVVGWLGGWMKPKLGEVTAMYSPKIEEEALVGIVFE